MKILHLATSDIEGGAARAAYRQHQGLLAAGCDSQMLVRAKSSKDPTVLVERSMLTRISPALSSLPLKRYPNKAGQMFSSQWFPDTLTDKIQAIKPDIVNLQWVRNGFLQIETIAKLTKLKIPLVWTLHDMWAFTGGCHYAQNCDRYHQSCGACPNLKSERESDLSRQVWRRKQKAFEQANLTVVAGSRWLGQCAQKSSLLKNKAIRVIPTGLDLQRYQAIDPQVARQILHLPQDKQLILFGSTTGASGEYRKGFHLLKPALQILNRDPEQAPFELLIFGGSKSSQLPDLNIKAHHLGQFHDDVSLSLVYAAADVMIVPSLQEAFGQTASEALACGTPVVAYRATGLQDIVTHQQDGYLAEPFEIEDLARGIAWVLDNPERQRQLSIKARQKAEQEFDWKLQGDRYQTLYRDILHQVPKTKN
ncbi:MAG: glycosyltransferase family 4 protein [Cyanobacteria bacterium P01_C01_bin.72]